MAQDALTFVAVGSNIDPLVNIRRCLEELRKIPHSTLVAVSSRYRTRPWGIEDQPEFVNLVVGLETRLSPRHLLRETQAIEARLARVRAHRNGPRTIDLDILLSGDRILDEPDLKIPHPGLTLRDFMLIPLLELAPDAVHPELGCPLRELSGEIRYQQIIARLPPGSASDEDPARTAPAAT